jgi:hypothetical protein
VDFKIAARLLQLSVAQKASIPATLKRVFRGTISSLRRRASLIAASALPRPNLYRQLVELVHTPKMPHRRIL